MIRFDPMSLAEYRTASKRIDRQHIDYEFQQELFPSLTPIRKYNTIIGTFFELLTQLVFGGVRPRHGNSELQPDLVGGDWQDVEVWDWMREVKAVSWNRECKVTLDQLEGYREVPARMKYTIFAYTIVRPFKIVNGMSTEDVFDLLASNVGFMMDLPLSIIQRAFKQNGRPHRFITFHNARTSNPGEWADMGRFSPTGMKAMMRDPYAVLNELGIKTSRYRFIKRMFPVGASINRSEVQPFPILMIKDRLFEESYISKLVPF